MHAYWFFGFWWLLFPLGWFLAAGFQSWLSYLRRKQELDLLKHYVAQGKDPPPELTKAVSGEHTPDPANVNHPYGPYGGYGYGWRARRWGWSPYWGWNRAVMFAAIAGGLYYWADRHGEADSSDGVMIAVVVLGVLAVSSAVMALIQTLNQPK
jgi:hypothetical protein